MYDARGVANYFLDRASRRGMSVTVMTLLKVLYFAHGWHLAKYGRPLVAQPFEAWKHGPVCRVVYDQLKYHKSAPIQQRLNSFDASVGVFVETHLNISDELQQFLNNLFDYYSQFHAFRLSDLTHEDESPWDVVWRKAEKKAVPGMVIPNDLIMEWFKRGSGMSTGSSTA